MRRTLVMLVILCMLLFAGQVFAFSITYDGVLDEWAGDEINNLGAETAPDGNSYTLLAVWDGINLYIGVDRETSGRYLGETSWDNDSFFIAIDTDGISDSGSYSDGYGRVDFNGPDLPDLIYYYAGGEGWYERSVWDGYGWVWSDWTNANTYYGWQPGTANDELTADVTVYAPALFGASELRVWAWMTREQNTYVEASWPSRFVGESPTMLEGIVVRDLETLLFMPHDPSPANYEEDVLVSGLELSWSVAQDPCGVVDPNLWYYNLYIGSGSDPNLYYYDYVDGWDPCTLRASYSFAANTDETYRWRIDTVLYSMEEIEGDVWTFDTEKVFAQIISGPGYQVVDEFGTAVFSVVVDSPSAPTYEWYKYVDGISDLLLANAGDISGADSNTLSISNVDLSDEGGYYCVVTNDAGISPPSPVGLLEIKKRIAYWPFEGYDVNSTVPGSPTSFLYGDPCFVPTDFTGDGLEFDNDIGAEDILYTDPCETSYFDICNYSMTVACWIKSSYAATWGPIVARNGEDDEGWQLRHSGFSFDRACFTTRGTGNDDGTPSNRTPYDGNWHYVVGTYDGTEKKVYIDGVLSRLYSSDDGSLVREYDEVSGLINSTSSPVAMAGRVKGDAVNGLIIEPNTVTPCILDEVEIYNYALDAEDIAQAYADTTGTEVCPVRPVYDLDGNCVVDFRDLALLASEWLNDHTVHPNP